MSKTELVGPKPDVEADVDPREFLVDITADRTPGPLELTVFYVACDDAETWCNPVKQTFTVTFEPDRDAGSAMRRGGGRRGGASRGNRPAGNNN